MKKENVITIPAKAPRDIKIPIDLKGAVHSVQRHAGKEADPALDDLAGASELIIETAEKIKTSCETILANPMATPIKNQTDARKTAAKLFERVAGKLDDGWQRSEKLIAQLEASTMPPAPKDAVSAINAGHVYAALRAMPEKERGKAVLDGSDAFSAAALACEDQALTGIFPEQRAALLHEWRRKRHGPILDRIERLRTALADYHRNCTRLQNLAMSVCADKVDDIAKADAAQKAADAAMAS